MVEKHLSRDFRFYSPADVGIDLSAYWTRCWPNAETIVFWEAARASADQPAVVRDFAQIWRAAEKIVYSRTLERVSSASTRIERSFDPGAIRGIKEAASSDITIGGAELAGEAIRA